MRSPLAIAIAALLGSTTAAHAWDDHALITWAALHDAPGMTWNSVPACTLDDLFATRLVDEHEPRLGDTLDEAERTAASLQPALPPRPDALRFAVPADFAAHVASATASATADPSTLPLARHRYLADLAALRRSLLAALRVNPNAKLADFVQLTPGSPALRDLPAVGVVDVTLDPGTIKLADPPLRGPTAPRPLDAPTLLATFSDEPDYGLDFGLFSDNGTPQAADDHFGPQPFGNPRLSFGSQAPFHMGYFHESSFFYRVAPAFRRTFPELRVAQYTALSRWAFSSANKDDTCSSYWGLRFLGWALHYAQDLTQPYHATLYPGKSAAGMIWISGLDSLGIHGPKLRAVTRLSNRHLALENIARRRLAEELARPAGASTLVKRMGEVAPDGALPGFDLADLRGVITVEAYADAPDMDTLLGECLPSHYVDDPAYDLGADPSPPDLYAVVRAQPSPSCLHLIEKLDSRLVRAAVHTRRLVRAFVPDR